MLRFWGQCCAAVSRIQDLGIVHYDIKCDNILLIKNNNDESTLREQGGDDDNEVPLLFTVHLCDAGEAVITRRVGKLQVLGAQASFGHNKLTSDVIICLLIPLTLPLPFMSYQEFCRLRGGVA